MLGPKDTFDARSLVHAPDGSSFVAADETLCYLGARARTDCQEYRVRSVFSTRRFRASSAPTGVGHENSGVDSTLRARVRDVWYRSTVFVDGSTTIKQVGRAMRER